MRDWEKRLDRTFKEVEMKMDAAQKRIDAVSKRMDEMQNEIMKKVERQISIDVLKDKFADGEKVGGYKWTYERSFGIRYCFTSNKIIYPGYKAYRGEITPDAPLTDCYHPSEIWLTKEEFTWRRIKGQI